MISALRNLIRFQLKAVPFSEIRDVFSPERVVQGRIVHQLNKGLFVLRTHGMNLVAEATVPLQVGDFVTTRVKRAREKIELKLVSVNGKPVENGSSIPVPDFRYARMPLPGGLFGRNGMLEIYDFGEKPETQETREGILRFQLVLETEEQGFVLVKVFTAAGKNFYKLYATSRDFYEHLKENSSQLANWFLEEEAGANVVQILYQSRDELFEPAAENVNLQRLSLRV